MKKIPKFVYVVIALVLVTATTVWALDRFDPTTTWNVTPVAKSFPGDRTCPSGTPIYDIFKSVTEGIGDGTATYSQTIDGLPVTINLTIYANNSFDFQVIGGVVHQMFVKGGADGGYLLYQYDPKVSGATNEGPVSFDTGLHDGYKSDAVVYQDVSHLDFCITPKGDPLTAEKTAFTSYTRTYTWDITKEYDGDYEGFIGDPAFNHDYEVSVDQTIVESLFKVYGTITVSNTNAFAVDTTISDSVGGVAATLSCGGSLTVPAKSSATCDYYAFLGSKVDGTNTATITSLHPYVDGTTAVKDYIFGEPTTVVGYPTINVTDSFADKLGSASGDKTFDTYYKEFQCSTNKADYKDGVWVMDDFVNTASIDEIPEEKDSATVKLTCYAPVLDKDASTSWEEKYDWEITKEPDGTYNGFIGDAAFDHGYIVTVDQTITPQNFLVEGNIYVTNPVGSPGNMTVSLADELSTGVFATVDCSGGATSVTVAPGAIESCAYSGYLATKTDGTNTATGTFNGVSFVTTEAYAFGAPTIVGYPTINVSDSFYGKLGSASGDKTFDTYYKSFQCPADEGVYTNGVYVMPEFKNTASIDETGQSDNAYVNLTCYAPLLDKDASASWEKKYDWTITKDYDGNYTGFIGDPEFDHGYLIQVDQTITEQNFLVSGSIYVSNPAGSPGNMTVSLVDELATGVFATVDCGGGATSVTVAPEATGTCSYSGFLAAKTDGTNTATGTFNKIDFMTTEAYAFGAPTIVGYPTINVTDTNGGSWSADGDHWWAYTKSFQCSTNPADYKDGVWKMEEFVNTASIDEIPTESDSAKVNLTCYAPVISKDASASYTERHIWDVDKTVNLTSQGGFPGSVLPWTWTVTVSEIFVEENFKVTGKITVYNPAAEPMTLILTDALSDGTVATIEYCETPAAEFVLIDDELTVPANTTATCYYTAEPKGRTATENKATGTFNGIDFVATADVEFVKTVVNGTATVTDTEIGLNKELTAGGGPWTYTKDYSHTCSSNRADYFVGGVYTQITETIINWAYVNSDGEEQDKDDATTTYTCDAGFMDLLKLTDGAVNKDKDWQFAIYLGPDGFGGTQVGSTSSTLNDVDGILEFGGPALRPDTTYTVCELGVAAGWTSRWEVSLDGGETWTGLIPYDPNEADSPAEDLGNRCVDFGYGTTIPVTVGTTIHFKVDNTYPGGAPRTPGYWKNWNRCTGGGQQYTADANGGWEEGFWLLEDVLDTEIGGGIIWDDILSDMFEFPITSCELAVSILDTRDFSTAKQMASDPGYNLAKHLLAAQLNFGAGACKPELAVYEGLTVYQVMLKAEELLDKNDFDAVGPGIDKKNKTDAPLALKYAYILDQYNNGIYCPEAEESH